MFKLFASPPDPTRIPRGGMSSADDEHPDSRMGSSLSSLIASWIRGCYNMNHIILKVYETG